MFANRQLSLVFSHCPLGRKAFLQVVIDLTTLEKCGQFKAFKNLISVYNGKRGLHIVVLYLVVGQWRPPLELSCLERQRYSESSPNGITNGA
jgi:hypothetical protein